MAKAPARAGPEQRHGNDVMAINLIQAQAQARLMQLPAFNMLMPMSGVQTNSAVKSKRPHQDPDKVTRTVFVENVGDDMDEAVCLTALLKLQLSTCDRHVHMLVSAVLASFLFQLCDCVAGLGGVLQSLWSSDSCEASGQQRRSESMDRVWHKRGSKICSGV